jgi:hypothetical protein
MAIRLSSGRENTWGLQGNNNAKFATAPHWRDEIVAKQASFGYHRKLEELMKQFINNFRSTYKRPTSIEKIKAGMQKHNESLCSYIRHRSVIKN